jgi:hypothetical protein
MIDRISLAALGAIYLVGMLRGHWLDYVAWYRNAFPGQKILGLFDVF